MNSTMNDLALLAIGIGMGLALALVAVMVYSLYRLVTQFRSSAAALLARVHEALAADKFSMDQLRGEVTLALSRVDAERLYSASLTLNRLVKSLASQVDTLQRALFAQPPAPAIDWTSPGTGLDDEAADDARMLAERARWQPISQPASQPTNQPPPDPLVSLTEEEKSLRVQQFFERRRAEQAAAGMTVGSGAYQPFTGSVLPPSTPPAAGSGIYSSLLDEAGQRPQPPSQPADFSGLEMEEGVELSGKGELG